MPTWNPVANDLFLKALEMGSARERQEYLDGTCAGDAALRAEVQALLEASAEAGSFLEPPVPPLVATVDEQPVRERPGTVIGPYKLLEQIGEGGFGIVFMAEQTHPVRRKVALKVLKPGMDTRQVVARFEAEQQALALMDHPHIARVFDGGATTSGRPYFVMELVKGVPITDFCDQNRLTPRQRLELFVQVCQAVQHAHQKGIIHRDLKPSNVLVSRHDTTPVAKVIDFGVAKALGQELTDKTLYTHRGQMVGTPLYMSPEQAGMSDLDVDTRSDIYSLGVLLYELLSGTTPFDKDRFRRAAYDEIRRIIREEEPPRPSTRLSTLGPDAGTVSANRATEPRRLSALVRGELDWIVMKALEKDRNRRYESATALADDVQRYLADEPVRACPPSAWYRFRKFARRNKRAIVPAAVLAVGLFVAVGAVAGSVGWAFRDRAARQTAVDQEASLALKEAERLHEQGRWPEALSAAKRAEGLLAGGGSADLREQVRLLRRDLELVLRLEEIQLLPTNELRENRFDFREADRAYVQAFADYGIDVLSWPAEQTAARIQARPGMAIPLAVALDDWATARPQEDRAILQAAAQAADPDPWRRQVRQAVQQKDGKVLAALAAMPELSRQPPISLGVLANGLRSRGNADAGVKVLRQGQQQYPGDFWINYGLVRALQGAGSSSLDEAVSFARAALAARPQSAAAHYVLGSVLQNQEKWDEAVACYKKAIDLSPTYASAYSALGSVHLMQGKPDEAIAACRKAIELDPKDAMAYNNLSAVFRSQKKHPESVAACLKAIELDPKHPFAYANLGIALREQGKPDEAIAAYRQAIKFNPKNGKYYAEFGLALQEQGKPGEAVAVYRQAIKHDPKSVVAYDRLGSTLFKQGEWSEGIAAYRKIIELDPTNAHAYSNIGLGMQKQGKLDEAIGWSRWAIDIDPKLANAHNTLGLAFQDQKKIDEAIVWYRKAIELEARFANAYSNLGNALRDQNKLDEAIACHRKAIEIDPRHRNAHINLGNIYYGQMKLDDALVCYRKALEIDPKSAAAHYGLGLISSKREKLDDAIASYRRTIEINPNHANAHCALGNALRRQGMVDDAIASYRRAIELDRKHVIAHDALGDSLGLKGWQLVKNPDPKLRDANRAIAASKEAVRLVPQSVGAWQYLGWVQYRAGNYKAAIEALEKSCELQKGGDAGQWVVLALAHAQLAPQAGLPAKAREIHKTEARRRFGQADKWIDTLWRVRPNHELGQDIWDFRAEARGVMVPNEMEK